MRVDVPIDYVVPPQKDGARYKMHKYWAAKPWYVVAEYIKHFTREGDIILDPFCGSGVVGCEALVHRRRAVLNDLNPMATFIAQNICRSPIDLDLFQREFSKIRTRVKDEIMDMYKMDTPCPVCGSGLYAKHLVRGPAQKETWIVEARCIKGHGRSGHIRRALTPGEKDRIKGIEAQKIDYWYPQDEFPDGRETMRLKKAGIKNVSQLFTRRNLMALSLIFNEIQRVSDDSIRDLLLLAFSNTLLHVSKLKSESLRPMSANSYYCMGDWIEENVWMRFENRVKWRWGVYEGKRETNSLIGDYFKPTKSFKELLSDKTFLITQGPAQNLKEFPDESVDYCFTDPPYGGSIQYYELTFLWRSWLKMVDNFAHDEIIVNTHQEKGDKDFEEMLTQAFQEVYRVLKPGRWLSVTFNNRDQRIWLALLKACNRAGFENINIVPQKPISSSFVQSWTGKSLKRDLILNFLKPKTKTVKFLTCNRGKDLDPKNIVLESTRKCIAREGKAFLSEIFEVATIRWIDMVYGCVKEKGESIETGMGEVYFDMDWVDNFLKKCREFNRIEYKNTIFYEYKD